MTTAEGPDTGSAKVPKVKPVHSAKLCQRLTAHRTAAVHAELVAQAAVALAAMLHYLIPKALPEHYGHVSSHGYLALSGENNHDSLLRVADDLPASPAWNAIETHRARWIAELPVKRGDLLPWLIEQDPGTTLLELLAFCTGTLLDGIADEEKPHAINRLAGALNLDMTRYWTPTRATYFDHVSKARPCRPGPPEHRPEDKLRRLSLPCAKGYSTRPRRGCACVRSRVLVQARE
jgi:ParB family chromosome partitioning protein